MKAAHPRTSPQSYSKLDSSGEMTRTKRIATGPMKIRNSVGKRKATMTSDIFTGIWLASSSARMIRLWPHFLGVDLESVGNARAVTDRLIHHRLERVDLLDARPARQVLKHTVARFAGAQLEDDGAELVGEEGMRRLQLLADLGQRGIEPEAGLNRDLHEVERMGEPSRIARWRCLMRRRT